MAAGSAGCVSRARGDADGDGTADSLLVYARIDAGRHPLTWHLQLTTATKTMRPALQAGNASSYPRAVGAADVNGDGRAEWFVKTLDLAGHGAPWQELGLFTMEAARFARVAHNGEPLALRVGGISRFREGVACEDGELLMLRAEAVNERNTRWRTFTRSLRLDGGQATFVGDRRGSLTLRSYNDPALGRFSSLRCETLRYPS